MERKELHDIATYIMAEKIGSDQVLDDLVDLIPTQELEKYLIRIDIIEGLGIFKPELKKVTIAFVVNNIVADKALEQMKQGKIADATDVLKENYEDSDYCIEDLY